MAASRAGGWRRKVQKFGGRTVHKLAVAILRSGVPVPPVTPRTALVLETKGRKSGRTRMTPMGYARVDNSHLQVVSENGARSDWVRNALANPDDVHVWLGGERFKASVAMLPDADPKEVWARQRSRLVVASAKALAQGPEVVGIELR